MQACCRLLRETFEPELLTASSRLQEDDGAIVEVRSTKVVSLSCLRTALHIITNGSEGVWVGLTSLL